MNYAGGMLFSTSIRLLNLLYAYARIRVENLSKHFSVNIQYILVMCVIYIYILFPFIT